MPRFTIRDLLWLTLIVGLVLGWAVDRARLTESGQRWEQRAEILALAATGEGWVVSWDGPAVTYRTPDGINLTIYGD